VPLADDRDNRSGIDTAAWCLVARSLSDLGGIMRHDSGQSAVNLTTGIAVGVAIGTALGVAMQNIAVGIGMGIGIGIAMSLATGSIRWRR
jgi:uncharacterized membrane protein (UPF0136 family)